MIFCNWIDYFRARLVSIVTGKLKKKMREKRLRVSLRKHKIR